MGGLRKALMANGQAGSVCDQLGTDSDVMRLLEAFGPRAEDGEDRRHGQDWKSGQYQGVRSDLATRIRVGLPGEEETEKLNGGRVTANCKSIDSF